MRLVFSRHQAHHRGYHIEGEKRGRGFLLRVTPVRAGLPGLPWARFRTIRGVWDKAVCDVTRYIDDFLASHPSPARRVPQVKEISGTDEMTSAFPALNDQNRPKTLIGLVAEKQIRRNHPFLKIVV